MEDSDPIVVLDVGGKRFKTRRSTLTAFPASLLGRMFDERNASICKPQADGSYFFDRSPHTFKHILHCIRAQNIRPLSPILHDQTEWDNELAFWGFEPPTPEPKVEEPPARLVIDNSAALSDRQYFGRLANEAEMDERLTTPEMVLTLRQQAVMWVMMNHVFPIVACEPNPCTIWWPCGFEPYYNTSWPVRLHELLMGIPGDMFFEARVYERAKEEVAKRGYDMKVMFATTTFNVEPGYSWWTLEARGWHPRYGSRPMFVSLLFRRRLDLTGKRM
jgi:hypothetical protein